MKDTYLLRLPEGNLNKLKRMALDMNCSINQMINKVLEQFIGDAPSESAESKLVSTTLNSSLGKNIEAIILFGSVAKSISTASSDYDLLIVMAEDVEIKRSLYRTWDQEVVPSLTFEMTNGKPTSPHFVNLKSDISEIHGLWLEVAISGKTLWMKNSKTDKLINKIRLAISQNEFMRKLSHGQPYWVRKNNI